MELIAIDTGTTKSAYCIFRPCESNIIEIDILENEELVKRLKELSRTNQASVSPMRQILVLEMFKSYGAVLGDTVLMSCVWIGRFIAAFGESRTFDLIPRKTIVTKLCGRSSARDSNVRQALIDHFAGINHSSLGEFYKVGTEAKSLVRKGGSLYTVKKDMWSALAVAVTYLDIKGDLLT
jgi:hypothetical protein